MTVDRMNVVRLMTFANNDDLTTWTHPSRFIPWLNVLSPSHLTWPTGKCLRLKWGSVRAKW